MNNGGAGVWLKEPAYMFRTVITDIVILLFKKRLFFKFNLNYSFIIITLLIKIAIYEWFALLGNYS